MEVSAWPSGWVIRAPSLRSTGTPYRPAASETKRGCSVGGPCLTTDQKVCSRTRKFAKSSPGMALNPLLRTNVPCSDPMIVRSLGGVPGRLLVETLSRSSEGALCRRAVSSSEMPRSHGVWRQTARTVMEHEAKSRGLLASRVPCEVDYLEMRAGEARTGFDMILVHAPSVYDFRDRDDVLFAYLSNSDSVHVSPIFEMPPVGILAIEQHLQRCGFNVEFFNVASQMLRESEFDVAEFFRKASGKYIGLDLHWLVHAHGALELATLYKEANPEAKTLMGGIASTYHHEELITYPQVDYVIRGYDTLLPIEMLMERTIRRRRLLRSRI